MRKIGDGWEEESDAKRRRGAHVVKLSVSRGDDVARHGARGRLSASLKLNLAESWRERRASVIWRQT